MVVIVASDAGEFECGLYHAERCIAIAVHDTIRERAVVSTDAHGSTEFFAEFYEWGELFTDAF